MNKDFFKNLYYKFPLIKYLYNEYKYLNLGCLFNRLKHIKHIEKFGFSNLYTYGNVVFQFHKLSKIILKGNLYLNNNLIKGSKREVLIKLQKNSAITVNGNFSIGYGSDILLQENAKLVLNSGFFNSNVEIRCGNYIEIGNNVAIARNVKILDSDFHSIYNNNNCINLSKPIYIKDNVWIGTGATILKGVTVSEGAIIGADSLVTKDVPAHSIVAGNPAKVIRKNVLWKGDTPSTENFNIDLIKEEESNKYS